MEYKCEFIEMIKDRGFSFEAQLKIEFLPLNNGSKKCLKNLWSLLHCMSIIKFWVRVLGTSYKNLKIATVTKVFYWTPGLDWKGPIK